jgi:hypothetical protein
MSSERKADIDAQLAELKFEIDLAIQQGAMPDNFQWTDAIQGPDGEPWIVLLSIGKVYPQPGAKE